MVLTFGEILVLGLKKHSGDCGGMSDTNDTRLEIDRAEYSVASFHGTAEVRSRPRGQRIQDDRRGRRGITVPLSHQGPISRDP